jgi:hypothetical protein
MRHRFAVPKIMAAGLSAGITGGGLAGTSANAAAVPKDAVPKDGKAAIAVLDHSHFKPRPHTRHFSLDSAPIALTSSTAVESPQSEAVQANASGPSCTHGRSKIGYDRVLR